MAASWAALASPPAAAGSETGQITALRTRSSDNLVFFNLNGTPTGKPACARYAYWMIKDENSAAGKRQFAMLMSAAMAGKTVTVVDPNQWAKRLKTDAEGRLALPARGPGRYVLVASHAVKENRQVAGETVDAVDYTATLSFVAR